MESESLLVYGFGFIFTSLTPKIPEIFENFSKNFKFLVRGPIGASWYWRFFGLEVSKSIWS